MANIDHQRRCIDDTLHYEKDISDAFARACEFLNTCRNNGVMLNSKKFLFAKDKVDFIGFTVTTSGVRPTAKFLSPS